MAAALTITRENSWRQAKKNESQFLYQVERAKSGRARCRRCSDFIAKGELRFAIPIRDPRGEFGYISAWQHVGCTRVDEPADVLEDKVHGLSSLSREDSKGVLKEVTSSSKPEHLQELNPDDLVKRGKIEPMPAPPAILQHLLPFQEEGLRWMTQQEAIDPEAELQAELEREAAERKKKEEEEAAAAAAAEAEAEGKGKSKPKPKPKPSGGPFNLERIPTRPCRGGILADEMGMGKTIQTISLIVANRGTGPTLVVAPVSSMMQWQEEIESNVAAGELDVKVYAKTGSLTKEQMELADVVLTTYPVLERAWRELVNEGKVACEYCGQLFLPRKLAIHNKYYCGPEAKRTAKLMKREKQRDNKVQSRETIKKGLKTLKVDIGDDDDEEDEAEADKKKSAKGGKGKKPAAKAAKKPAAKKGSTSGKKAAPKKSNGRKKKSDESSDDDDDWSDVSSSDGDSDAESVVVDKRKTTKKGSAPAPKKAKPAGKKAAPKRGSKKKEATPEESSESDNEDEAGATQKRGVVGPMGMYRELMQEAGRRARSRWEKARVAPSDDDEEDDGDGSSSADDDDSDATYEASSSAATESDGDDDDSGADSDDSKAAKKRKSKDTNPIMCRDCGMQLAAHEFCPETGEKHPAPKLRAIPPDDEDTGADVVDISKSQLHSVNWFRVVLDEAHRIKGRTTSTARSAYALRADRKWCLTGTPLQNRVGDLYSLLRFLRLTPYARYYCQAAGCKCTTLSHPFSRDLANWCVYCGHGPLQHYSYFNRHVMNPIVRYGYVGDGRKSMMLLTGDVLNRVMLRRTKAERAEDIKLPPCEIEIIQIDLSAAERDFYSALYKKSASKFDTFVDKGTLLHNYAHIFQLLSRLRQALDHPYLVLFSDGAYAAAAAAALAPPPAPTPAKGKKAAVKPDDAVKKEEADGDDDASAARKPKRSRSSGKAKKEEADVKPEPVADDDGASMATTAAATLGITLAELPAAAVMPSDVCHLCQESTCPQTKFVVEPCRHGFHRLCLKEYIESLPPEPAAAAPAPAAADGKPAPKKSGGKKKTSAEAAPGAPRCPRCFVHIAFDLRRLAHVIDDEANDDDSAGSDAEGSPAKSASKAKGGSKKKPAAKKAARSEAGPAVAPLLAPARPDDDDDEAADGDDTGLFTTLMPARPGDGDGDEDDVSTAAAGAPSTTAAAASPVAAKPEFRAGSIMNRIDTSKFVAGTKLEAVVDHVRNKVPADEKVIVFSQFGAMLDLVEFALERAGVRTVKLMGHMPLSQRQAMLRAFRHEPGVKCIMISLKAGGEGLNLQCANHVVLIDPWWNPAVEMQAVQRAHRIGQRKVVKAVRFVTRDSIEERMMSLQEKKMLVFQGTVDGSADSLQRLSEEDLQFLFTR